jgi:LacI family transcriptional regulator
MHSKRFEVEKKVTIKDIAERMGTSVATVHRALYGLDGVSDQLRQQILDEAQRCNYEPDKAASMLRRKTLNIAVVLPKPVGNERFYYKGLWEGIYAGAEELKKSNMTFDYIQADRGINDLAGALETLFDSVSQKPDGLITLCDDEKAKGWIKRFIRRGVRVALVDRGIDIKDLICSVQTSSEDMAMISAEVLKVLIKSEKHEPVVIVNGPEWRVSYKVYADKIRELMSSFWPDRKVIFIDGYDENAGIPELKEIFATTGCAGIIATCARTTYWVCRELSKLPKEKIPPIVGTDVFEELAPYFEEGVLKATIYQSHREHGEKAIQYLYDSFSDYSIQREVKILGRLSIVIKESYKYFI